MARLLGEAPGCMFFPWCLSGPGSGPTYSGNKVFAFDEKVTALAEKGLGCGGRGSSKDFLKNPHHPSPIKKVQRLRWEINKPKPTRCVLQEMGALFPLVQVTYGLREELLGHS